MISERNAGGVARYIKDSAQNNWSEYDYVERYGVKLTHVYMGFQPVPAYQAPPPEIMDSYKTMLDSYESMNELFDNSIPLHWIAFLQKVETKRKQNGCEGPIDLLSAIHFFAEEHPTEASRINIKPFEMLPNRWPDLSDKALIEQYINNVLGDKITQTILLRELANQLPDVGNIHGDIETLKEVSDALGLTRRGCLFPKKGLVVDLGCGPGDRLVTICEKLDMRGVGVDRQQHSVHYEMWRHPPKDVRFLQGDTRTSKRGVRKNSAALIVIENVSYHVTPEALKNTIKQAFRVLSPQGVLAFSPQSYEYKGLNQPSDGYWRFFVKTTNSRGEDMFIRKTLKQIKAAGASVEVK